MCELRPFLVGILAGWRGAEIIGNFTNSESKFAGDGVLVELVKSGDIFQGWGSVIGYAFVHGTGGKAFGHSSCSGSFGGSVLEPLQKPWVFFKEGAPEARFRQDGPIGYSEGAALEAGDDGVAHVWDQDRHCWYG